jgi:hypothetical protein
VWFGGRGCGEERWRIERAAAGYVATGEQVLVSPHPFPNRHEWRIALTPEWRLTAVDVLWSVGTRHLEAEHRAEGWRWRARLTADGQVREQQGDYPPTCEVEHATLLSNTFILAKRDFQLDGEHEFPALRIGPPLMAVTPARMLIRCAEIGRYDTPLGPVPAKRYRASLEPGGDVAGYTFWADQHDIVLEAYEGHDPSRPWMRLVEYRRPLG